MSICNACYNEELKQRLKDKYLLIKETNTVYKLDAPPEKGQNSPYVYQGRSIQFVARFMSINHTYDEDCQAKGRRNMRELIEACKILLEETESLDDAKQYIDDLAQDNDVSPEQAWETLQKVHNKEIN